MSNPAGKQISIAHTPGNYAAAAPGSIEEHIAGIDTSLASVPPSGPAGGILAGTYPNPSLAASVVATDFTINGKLSMVGSVDTTIRFDGALASFLIQPLIDPSSIGGIFTIEGQQGASTSAGGKVVVQGGKGGASAGVGGDLDLKGGETLTSSQAGAVNIVGGSSFSGAGGTVKIDGGSGTGGGGDLLFASMQGTLGLGRAGMITSVTGSLSVAEATTLNGNVSIAGAVDSTIRFDAVLSSFLIQPLDDSVSDGGTFTIQGQNSSVPTKSGGDLVLTAGVGGVVGAGGDIKIDGGTTGGGGVDGNTLIAATRGGLTLGRVGMATAVSGFLTVASDITVGGIATLNGDIKLVGAVDSTIRFDAALADLLTEGATLGLWVDSSTA